MTLKQYRDCLAWLRWRVRGKQFADDPESFKDIESLKAKLYKAHPEINPNPREYGVSAP